MTKARRLATMVNHRLPALLGLFASAVLGALSRSLGRSTCLIRSKLLPYLYEEGS
jgi:hypothetical protein